MPFYWSEHSSVPGLNIGSNWSSRHDWRSHKPPTLWSQSDKCSWRTAGSPTVDTQTAKIHLDRSRILSETFSYWRLSDFPVISHLTRRKCRVITALLLFLSTLMMLHTCASMFQRRVSVFLPSDKQQGQFDCWSIYQIKSQMFFIRGQLRKCQFLHNVAVPWQWSSWRCAAGSGYQTIASCRSKRQDGPRVAS